MLLVWRIYYGKHMAADILRQLHSGRYITAEILRQIRYSRYMAYHENDHISTKLVKYTAPEALDC